jgi:OOP family OmpA-OmpF porin
MDDTDGMNGMTGSPRRFAVFASLLGLSACLGLEPTAVTRLETKGDSFQAALHAEYAELAVKESTLYDWTSATIFARKAEASAEGQPVAPEMPEIWGIDPMARADLDVARERLVTLLEAGRKAAPGPAASAQAAYDCWLEEQEEGHQIRDIQACRERWEVAMAEVQTALQPALSPAAAPPEPLELEFEVFFPLNGTEPRLEDRLVMAEVVRVAGLVEPRRISISGHADRSGSPAYNERLSRMRAEAVASELVDLGLAPPQLEIAAFGEAVPAVPTADDRADARNRRVVIRLL